MSICACLFTSISIIIQLTDFHFENSHTHAHAHAHKKCYNQQMRSKAKENWWQLVQGHYVLLKYWAILWHEKMTFLFAQRLNAFTFFVSFIFSFDLILCQSEWKSHIFCNAHLRLMCVVYCNVRYQRKRHSLDYKHRTGPEQPSSHVEITMTVSNDWQIERVD